VLHTVLFLLAAVAALAAAAPSSAGGPAARRPVASLEPAATQKLWKELVQRPRPFFLTAAGCRPARVLFYAQTDWIRLATKLAANASPCAEYLVSIPPLSGDKTSRAV